MATRMKRCYMMLIVVMCTLLILFWQPEPIFKRPVPYTQHNLPIILEKLQDNSTPMTILLWTSFFGTKIWLGRDTVRCPTSHHNQMDVCIFTNNRSEFLDSAEALVFFPRSMDYNKLPPVRHPWHKWIFFDSENPVYEHPWRKLIPLKNAFNLTMTYHKNSSVVVPYGHCQRTEHCDMSKGPALMAPSNFRKRRSVAWFVSNCYPQSRRDLYVKELKQFIDIDVYGKCGDSECKKKNMSCYREILHNNYKFYLAFENALCDDYVSEKPFKLLTHKINVVPIVLGNVKYEDHLPPGSYIDVRQYQSPKKLAEYLHYLSNNETMYMKYFEWRKCYRCNEFRYIGWRDCALCTYLHRNRREIEMIRDINEFWSADHCQLPYNFYKGILDFRWYNALWFQNM